jgi:F420-non-reducing hydrogenase iron-sulfur subunit
MTIKRITFLQELLKFMGLDERLHLDWISSAEAQKFAQVVSDFTEKIQSMGASPLTGKLAEIDAKSAEVESVEGG